VERESDIQSIGTFISQLLNTLSPHHQTTDSHSYTIAIALGVIPFMANMQGMHVTGLRKASKVPYPYPYATVQQAKEDKAAYRFNCGQRAHQNLWVSFSSLLNLWVRASEGLRRGGERKVWAW
jgi:hypothetical protein